GCVAMLAGQRVAVVVPAYDVADRISATVRGVPRFVDYVIVVDDGSADGTGARAAELGCAGLEVLAHAQNLGVGAAIATGYRRALALGADIVAVMAGDGQMDPRDLLSLLGPLVRGEADYTKGNRFRDPAVWRRMPPLRLVGNVVLSLLTRLASGLPVFDSQCGYTAARRGALLRVGTDLWPRYGYPNDLLARMGAAGLRVRDVGVRAVYDGARSGMRWFTVVYPIGWLLACAMAARLARVARRPALPATEPS
ncbi:MAG: glycosyltransferase family 2 protein, partial [Myxococcota bacterium]